MFMSDSLASKSQNQPAVKFVRILLASLVEIEAKVSIDADAEIVVHNKDGRRVLVLLSCVGVIRQCHLCFISLLLVWMKYHCPSAHIKT